MQPKFSGTSSSTNKEGSGRLLSLESVPSRGGTFVQPSETLYTHISGLQVAVAVGLEGDPLGRKDLGLPASAPVVVVAVEVVGMVEVMAGVEVSKVVPPNSSIWHLLRKFQCYHLILPIPCGKEASR